eukprot:TRINITY_DN4148_c0_g1_i1.p1 TRINITY_DN4148_c0_g1~~TRINITY_DN4148_c0_g1_i1.p1  ORF type:complete len:231 (-),score=20.31 TRINITY_DN4148_c0_g1_i1:51-743(-)
MAAVVARRRTTVTPEPPEAAAEPQEPEPPVVQLAAFRTKLHPKVRASPPVSPEPIPDAPATPKTVQWSPPPPPPTQRTARRARPELDGAVVEEALQRRQSLRLISAPSSRPTSRQSQLKLPSACEDAFECFFQSTMRGGADTSSPTCRKDVQRKWQEHVETLSGEIDYSAVRAYGSCQVPWFSPTSPEAAHSKEYPGDGSPQASGRRRQSQFSLTRPRPLSSLRRSIIQL